MKAGHQHRTFAVPFGGILADFFFVVVIVVVVFRRPCRNVAEHGNEGAKGADDRPHDGGPGFEGLGDARCEGHQKKGEEGPDGAEDGPGPGLGLEAASDAVRHPEPKEGQ